MVHVAVDGKYAGYILISDVIKDGAKEAIASLKNSGVKKSVMLTSDSKTVAEHVAGELKMCIRDSPRSQWRPPRLTVHS